MTVYSLENGMLGVRNERPDINDPTIPRHGSQPPTYICIDTLEVFQDTGSDWLLVGQFGITGLASDGRTPGGIIIAGAITAGDDAAADVPTLHTISGAVTAYGGGSVDVDGGTTVTGITGRTHSGDIVTLQADSTSQAAQFIRRGTANGHKWTNPVVLISDGSDDTSESSYVLQVDRANITVLGIDEFGMWASQPYHGPGAQLTGAVTAPNAALAGPGGTTPTLAVTKLAGQTGLFIACTDENNAPKVSIAVDGEIVTADDVLAPNGVIKGATVALYASGTGAPSSGTHTQGEFHADTAGALFYCIADGTPGTWKTVSLT